MIPSWCILWSIVLSTLPVSSQGRPADADWPTFRGADRSGVSHETDLLQTWPKEGPPMRWKVEGTGRGYTSLAIVGRRIFLMGDEIAGVDDDDEYLLCHDRDTGQRLWAAKTGPAWNEGAPNWQGPRSTPTVDGTRVYVLTARGDLICYDSNSGAEQWRKNLKADFGGVKADGWGYSESVLIDGERLVCTPGGEKATIAALDKRNGETVWTVAREGDRGAGHASIAISEVGGVRVYVQTTGGGALGVRANDGKLMWSYPIDKTTAVAPTPIVRDDLVFFTAGYRRGGALLKQSPDGRGGVDMEEIYPLNPQLANKHGGVVLIGDYLYGDTDDSGILYCAELMSGEVLWKNRGSGSGSIAIAAADGCLYLHYADGTMVLAKASPESHAEVGSFTVPNSGDRPSWAQPVILDGELYVREHNAILCFDIRQKSTSAATGEAQ